MPRRWRWKSTPMRSVQMHTVRPRRCNNPMFRVIDARCITMANKSNSKAASSRTEILLVEDLRKSYGPRPALHGLSFSLKAGRVMGFLGPNGAGKTTAIRILTTILEPDSGYFFVEGIGSEYPEKIRQRI